MKTKVEYLLYVPGRVSEEIYWSRHTTRANAIKRAKKDGKEIVRIEKYSREVK
jgi:hypothetical protein